MSDDRVTAVRETYAAFARGDLDGALALMDEDIVWHQAQGLPHGGTYHGLAAVRANVFAPIEESWWEGFGATPEAAFGCGEHVLVLGRYTAKAKATGRPLDVPFAHFWEFRGDRAVVFRQFTDTRGWTDALDQTAASH